MLQCACLGRAHAGSMTFSYGKIIMRQRALAGHHFTQCVTVVVTLLSIKLRELENSPAGLEAETLQSLDSHLAPGRAGHLIDSHSPQAVGKGREPICPYPPAHHSSL